MNNVEPISFEQDKTGNRLIQMMQVTAAAKGSNLSDQKIRNFLNKKKMQDFRQQLRDAGIIIVFKEVGRKIASEYMQHSDFVKFFLQYVEGWKNAPRGMLIPPPRQVTASIDPRTTFDMQLATSVQALLLFMLAVIHFHKIIAVQGLYLARKLIFGAGVYKKMKHANTCLSNLSE